MRRELTDEQISRYISCTQALWPLGTDLLHCYRNPTEGSGSLYCAIHPDAITDLRWCVALLRRTDNSAAVPKCCTVRKEFSPVENPSSHRQEFSKPSCASSRYAVVELGVVNLIPILRLRCSSASQMMPWRRPDCTINRNRDKRLASKSSWSQDLAKPDVTSRDYLSLTTKKLARNGAAELEETLQGFSTQGA